MITWIAELAELGYRIVGTRRGRLLLAHLRTGWRISLPAGGPACDMYRAILRHGAVPRPIGAGVVVRRVSPHHSELFALMAKAPVGR